MTSEPELARLGHVAFETPALTESVSFFRDAVGLQEVDRDGDTVYLRGVDEFYHHSLSLTAADSAGVDHVGWQTREPEHVDGFADRLAAAGLDVERVEAGTELGQGDAVRFDTPSGHRFEFYYDMEKPDPPAERRSRLKNRPYDPAVTGRTAPRQVDHVQLWDADALALADWLEGLGLRLQESFTLADGTRWGSFLSASRTKIDAAVIQGDADQPPELHHVAYEVGSVEDLFAAADAMAERGIEVDSGPGQHAFSRRRFLYVKDPASGVRIEFSTGGYTVYDPDWDTVAWTEADIGDGDDHQWIGQLDMPDRVGYVDGR
jgi:catechol 2,3-dioxygenase